MTTKPVLKDLRVKLPTHPFFYTQDQVAILLSVTPGWLRARMSFQGRFNSKTTPDTLEAINLARPDEPAEWRISERELLRWLARQGYRVERA